MSKINRGSNPNVTSSPSPSTVNQTYDISQLMTHTRQLAADYRQQTGHALPVTEELARFDAVNLLSLVQLGNEAGVDAIEQPLKAGQTINRYIIKGRVIFKAGKARQKLGQLNFKTDWTHLLMVIYHPDYQPKQIYQITRQVIETQKKDLNKDKRGSMTVAKYKAIGELRWQDDELLSEAKRKAND